MNKRLYVEGKDDKFVIEKLRDERSITSLSDVDIVICESFEQLAKKVKGELTLEREGIYGILADADDNISAQRDAVLHAIQQPIKELTQTKSNLYSNDFIRIGYYLFPDDTNTGSLETLLLSCAKDKGDPKKCRDLAAEMVVSALNNNCLPTATTQNNRDKAILHAWLALQPTRVAKIEPAWNNGYFDTNSPAFQPLADWLRILFV
jgi:hypothetical protein